MSNAYLAPDVITYPPNIAELNKKVLEEYQKKPLGFVFPPGFSGNNDNQDNFVEIPDPLQCFKDDFDVFLEDAELLANSLVGCIPGFGPLLQGVMTITLNKLKPPKLTKEDVEKAIDAKLPALKEELIEILDKKIEKAEIQNYKDMCNRAFNALSKDSMELLFDDLVLLRKKLKKGIIPDPEDLGGLRNKFDDLRINLKASMPMFSNKQYIEHVYQQYIQIMCIYVSIMYQLVFHWFTYGYDPDLARGTPAIGNLKRTHGYREKIHINIQKMLKNIQDGVKTSKPGMNNLHQMLTYDPVLYPIKLIIGNNSDRITVDQSHRPYIYRIDGDYFVGGPSISNTDPITNCKGISINTSIEKKVTLSEKKYVRVRCFTSCDVGSTETVKLYLNGKEMKAGEFIEMGALKYSGSPSEIKSGFYHFDKLSDPVTDLTIKVEGKGHRLLFCEITISDK